MKTNFKNIKEIIDYAAEKFKSRIAFKIKHKKDGKTSYDEITYERLKREIEIFGAYLEEKGLLGKNIAVAGKNSYEWMVVYLSVLYFGGVIIPLDKGLLDYEAKDQLSRAEVGAIFSDDKFGKMIEDCEDVFKMSTESDEFHDILSGDVPSVLPESKIDDNKMSILIFTSGTTSKSKAVMLSQRNIAANVNAMNDWEKFYEEDVNLAILPFHHAFGMTQIALFLSCGMCNVFSDGLRIARALVEYRVTVLVGVPLILEGMQSIILKEMKKKNKLGAFNTGMKISKALRTVKIDVRRKLFGEVIDNLGGGLRLIISGAAPLKPETAKWFNDIGIVLIQGYGLSETSPVVAAENDKHLKYGSVGYPLPGVKVKIVNPDEKKIGEIAVSGENVMLGYYKDEEQTNKVLKDGWFYTGDMGYFDKDGYLYVSGRKKNVIVLTNGKNVFPEEIEQMISDAPFIKECIVTNKGNNGKDMLSAKIVYDSEYENVEEKINAHIKAVNDKLIKYKRIRDIDLTDKEMEKTTTGKIKR